HGGTPRKQRDAMIERFQQASGGPPVFVLSLKAGGTGLNLTRASHVFHFDRWWNPAVENQATDRAFRIGQTRNVQVHKFVCGGTVEEKIDALIEDRKSTRLNSSHVAISYAVFCLKKKKKKISKKYNKTTKKENAKKISRHNKTK